MARVHWRTGVREVRGSLSLRAYMRVAQRYVPDIGAHDVVRAGSGICRRQASHLLRHLEPRDRATHR